MRALASALFLCCLAAPVLAAPAPASSDKSPSDKTGAPGANVEMPFLMAPLTGSDGKLSGYAYISTRLTATSGAGALDVRDKIAFIQDAFVLLGCVCRWIPHRSSPRKLLPYMIHPMLYLV